jgi:hypothetical protein
MLNLYPTVLPKAEIAIVLNGIRKVDDGHSLADRIEAAWWLSGYGASFIPDSSETPPRAALSEDEVVHVLEATLIEESNEGYSKLPWSLIVQFALQLVSKWLLKQE